MENLYKHQQDIISEDPKKKGLWLGTGSGKTRTALYLARGKTLVIAPKTQVLDKNWKRENTIGVDLTVISKETFRRDYLTLPRFETVIVDEAHTVLGVTPNIRYVKRRARPKASQLFEALEEFVKTTNPDRLYLATATIVKSPMTVWGAGKILGMDWDWYKFRDTFYVRLPMPGREVFMAKSDKKTKEKLATFVKKTGYVGRLDDYFDVPAQTFRTINIELTEKQKKRIKELPFEFPEPLVRVGKIHQVENGVLSGDEFNKAEFFDNGKIEKILDLALEFPRMVIFARYTAQIEMIVKALLKEGYKVLTLTGQTKDRGGLLRDANQSLECIVVAQCQISAGWELPSYPCMIFASRNYSFVDYEQSLGRIQRANNIKKNLYINLVVKGMVDESVNKCLENKSDFNEKLYGI